MIGALETILQRPKTVLTLMVVLVVAGVLAYIGVPKEANPDIDVPVYYISISQQGVSPKDSERLLVRPMETTLRGLEGLKEITAVASQSHAAIILEFNIGTDKDKVLADIRDKVDQAQAQLPADADEPAVFETNFALQPTIIVTLSGKLPERTLFSHARKLKDEIEAISTVREANLSGNREEMLEVELDLLKMESYNLTQVELINALTQNNQLVAAGFIDDGQSRFNVKVPGLVESGIDVYNIPVRQNGEGVVTLGDVAKIKRTFKDASSFTRVNGEPAISIEVVKRIGTNIIENNMEVRRIVAEFTKEWPDPIKINYLLDQSNFINEVLGSLQSAIMTAIVLVIILVVGTLGVRSGLLIGLAIPTSFMVGFLILSSLGMTVNMMVMFGLVLTVGMLVDGAIVVTEYADRKMAEGMHSSEAYRRAARLMFWPVVSSTATTLAAFLPLLLWPGTVGEFMSYLPIMVIIVLTASLLTALIFIPATGAAIGAFSDQAARLFKRKKSVTVVKQNNVALMLSSSSKLDLKAIPGNTGAYLRFLNALTVNLFRNILVIAAAVAIVIWTFGAFSQNNAGVEFFVEEEPDVAIVFVSARGNLAATKIRDIAVEVEKQVLQIPGIDNVVMSAQASGGGGGGGGIDLEAPQDMPADVVATMQVELADYSQRRRAVEIFDDIKTRTADIAGIKIEIRKIEGGPPTGKDVRLQVKSTSYDQMVLTVSKIRKYLDGVKDIQDLEDDRPLPGIEWELSVDRQEAGRYNAGITSVGAMIQLVTNGVLLGKYRPDDSEDELDIRVRLPKEQRSLDQLDQLRLQTSNGQVPISNFVTMTPVKKVSSITRIDGQYAMSLKANLVEGAKFENRELTPGDKINEIQTWLDTQEWPDNIFMKFRGADEEQEESGAFLAQAAMGALFMMFIILLTQFNSFYQTILTLMTVILAIVGVLLGLMITGQKFSIIMTGTGIVALAGIVVNNAIVLIDTYNRLRAEGADVHDAILKTSAQRMRPIMLTTVTTILGLIPMALAINVNFIDRIISYGSITAIWWVQLSTAVISGLAFSTLLTLILIPVMLSMPTNITSAFSAIMRKKPGQKRDQLAVAGAGVSIVDEPDRLEDMAVAVKQIAVPKPANNSAGKKTKSAQKKKKSKGKSPEDKDFSEAAE
ncbi:MAG: efflux RND transporter permease subunit [Rhizobiaceae bacterium]|nr:efflux RND transporter permease subunit [Rhizobiaceae bacterium]